MTVLWLLLSASFVVIGQTITQEFYTTNSVCKQRFCINPVFPGLSELATLEAKTWTKQDLSKVNASMDFCGGIVNYDPALPAASLTAADAYSTDPVLESAVESDRSAANLYFYHLSGMGIEAWDHTAPLNESLDPLRPCALAVARLACFTYFPKAFSTAQTGVAVAYQRPCSSCCEDYIRACNIECCDESVSCVFSNTSTAQVTPNAVVPLGARPTLGATETTANVQTGYTEGVAPSVSCTGTAL